MRVLYISYDGITDHIGRSQVAPYLIELARIGYLISIVSAEKTGRDALISEYAELFSRYGIEWRFVKYRRRPPVVAQAATILQLYWLARTVLGSQTFGFVHCRDLFPTSIGYRLKRPFGVKLLYDFRNFTADGGLETSPFKFVYWYFKWREKAYIRTADKVVCLTHGAADVLAGWYLQDQASPKAHFQVIPCCADFQHFNPANVTAEALSLARSHAALSPGEPVLLYLGSLGPDYLLSQMLALFRQMLTLRPDAKFLFLSNNGRELVDRACEEHGIGLDKIRFVSVDRKDVPAYICLAHLSVVFIRPGLSKKGCSPTKLAELFACNIPVIANTGVGDLDRIISLERNGSVVVKDFGENALLHAVRQVLENRSRRSVNIRHNSREFALEAGVERYAAVYDSLLKQQPTLEHLSC